MPYKHGTYGEFAESVVQTSTSSETIPVYIGTAPVNLIRGYSDYVNAPVYLADYNAVKRYFGYSSDWKTFTLCEAFKAHFDNSAGNVAPIVAINVLDPDTHKKSEATTKSLTFTNGRATLDSDTIILDTLVLADKVEGTDFSIDYDFTKNQVIIDSISDTKITGAVNATYSEIDTSTIDKDSIIGGVTAGGTYTGLGCIGLVYQELNVIPNIIAAPGWSDTPEVYEAMITAGTKINGHWDAIVVADIPIDGVQTVDAAIEWQTTNSYTNERSKVCYPQAVDTAGRVYHISTLTVRNMMIVDATHDGIPMESPSNKSVPIAKQYFGESSTNRGFDQTRANDLNASGITTVVYWGGEWVLWGPHTAAYKYGNVSDKRAIFDNSIRMMMYVSNSFQQEWATTIDEPMTRSMAETVLNREQEKADALAAVGALIGTPVVSFNETENSTDEVAEGNFVWGFLGTPTPPFKSGTLKVAYTDEGFDTYFSESESE